MFDSTQGLLRSCEHITGPFRIAIIDPETQKIIAVEANTLNLHVFSIDENGEAFQADLDLKDPKNLLPTVDRDGREDTIRAADMMRSAGEKVCHANVVALFAIDSSRPFEPLLHPPLSKSSPSGCGVRPSIRLTSSQTGRRRRTKTAISLISGIFFSGFRSFATGGSRRRRTETAASLSSGMSLAWFRYSAQDW